MAGEYNEPWRVASTDDIGETAIYARDGMLIATVLDDSDWDMDEGWAPPGELFADAERIVACVNAMDGVPTETLRAESKPTAVLLALAVLRGDDAAARALADRTVEEVEQVATPIAVGDVVQVDPDAKHCLPPWIAGWTTTVTGTLRSTTDSAPLYRLLPQDKSGTDWFAMPYEVRRVGRAPFKTEALLAREVAGEGG